jgi:hypothetical protein
MKKTALSAFKQIVLVLVFFHEVVHKFSNFSLFQPNSHSPNRKNLNKVDLSFFIILNHLPTLNEIDLKECLLAHLQVQALGYQAHQVCNFLWAAEFYTTRV